MNADQFLTNFGHAAMAPLGVKRLRELVLHLAVSGRLVPRILSEGDGAASIADASALKLAYRSKHKLRPSGSDRPLAEFELEFEIPTHWTWERLGNIACYIQRGKGPRYDEAGKIRVVSQKCVQWSGFDLSSARRISDDSVKGYSHERFLVSGDILWNSTGTGTAGRLVVYPGAKEQVVADSHVTIIRLTNFVPAYVWSYLASPTIQQRMTPGQENSMVTGTTNQVELSASKVSELPIPCPPLAEQKRIVAKVDELMALCDQLEAQQQERERRFPVLSRTCHDRFAEVPTPANLNRIFYEVGSVSPADLRKTIFTLAVHGKLVAQDPREESATKLLERVAVKRDQLLKNGYPNSNEAKTQLRKQHAQRLPEGLQYLPVGWKWATLMQTCLLVVDCHNKTAPYVSSGIRLIRTTNIRAGQLNALEPKYVSEATYERWSARCKPEPGDILITREAPMGEVCIIPQGVKLCMGQRMMLIRLVPDTVDVNFLLYSLMDPELMQRVKDKPIGATVQHLRVGGVETLLVAIPPLAEQRRIVAKVDELMALVDQLEAQQRERDKLAAAFAKACVASFTGTTQLERPEKMKAPKTELVSLVTLGKKPRPEADASLARLLIQNKGTLPAKSLWQQSGLTIDAFYQQLKTEIAQGWIAPPVEAEMRVLEQD
ncbi:restriction endonuclease subunit S [Desulfonatronum thiodismutans]|uniref:restriction endonuclease subunit S n=1 Tax=Desulfonatronum thiodismutans TaxID=159290 RepID=UPI000689C709|nr:restriction endonuclease subunit S [Desulfonatronum thiodismutans]